MNQPDCLTNVHCPTCNHLHPHRLGLSLCLCEDCGLMWTMTRPEHLADEYRVRYEKLWRLVAEREGTHESAE